MIDLVFKAIDLAINLILLIYELLQLLFCGLILVFHN